MANQLSILATLFAYSDWSNRLIIEHAAKLSDEQLDRPLDIGRGSLRVNLLHTLAGESVWLRRWREEPLVPWPDEKVRSTPAEVLLSFEGVWQSRDEFLAQIAKDAATRLARDQVYRDSRGSLFKASLLDMLLQGYLHAKHHQAQSVNMLRRVGGEVPEVDYMGHVRRPA